jgi:hypothetical protein
MGMMMTMMMCFIEQLAAARMADVVCYIGMYERRYSVLSGAPAAAVFAALWCYFMLCHVGPAL